MATSIKEISAFLDSENLKYEPHADEDYILTGFKMPNYKNAEGRDQLLIVIKLEEEGEFLKLFTPKAYQYKDGPHLGVILQACMFVSWRTKMLQYEFDPSDGEIRAVIEFPLEDAKLTKKQFMRVLMAIPELIDKYDGMIRGAIEKGKIESPDDPDAAFLEILGDLSTMTPDQVKALLEEIKRRKGGEGGGSCGGEGPDRL